MNPKVRQLLDSVKQLVTEIEAGESGEMESESMEEPIGDEGMEDESMSEESMPPPMQKKMGGGMPESLRKFTGGR